MKRVLLAVIVLASPISTASVPTLCPLHSVRCNGDAIEECSGSLWEPIEQCSDRCIEHPGPTGYKVAKCVGKP